jgi:hypothetical protein
MNACHVEPFAFAQDRLRETSPDVCWQTASPDDLRFFSRDRGIRMTNRKP